MLDAARSICSEQQNPREDGRHDGLSRPSSGMVCSPSAIFRAQSETGAIAALAERPPATNHSLFSSPPCGAGTEDRQGWRNQCYGCCFRLLHQSRLGSIAVVGSIRELHAVAVYVHHRNKHTDKRGTCEQGSQLTCWQHLNLHVYATRCYRRPRLHRPFDWPKVAALRDSPP